MLENFNYIFQYLEKEQIDIDKNEFQFQIQSHPDFPSLVSTIDTLSFLNIDNGVLHVDISEIELLPDYFVALLDAENSQPQFHFIEKKGDVYFSTKDKIVISKQKLESRWKNTVLLVEKSETDNITQTNKNKWFQMLTFLCVVTFFLILLQFQVSIETKLFFVFPILGILLSIAALKDLFGTKSELLNNFCNITSTSSCNSVINSNKWKIFEIISFSDLSMVFFSTQFLGLLLFLLTKAEIIFVSFQMIILICALPIILISVYYQKVVEKKWCPICLAIISTILFELGYIYFLLQTTNDFPINDLIIFAFVVGSVTVVWFMLKNLLTTQKDLKEFKIKSSRFMRNYVVFKNNLLAENKKKLAYSPIILGNKESNLEIAIITSPFCGHCKGAHRILEDILIKNKDILKIKILINADLDNLDDEKKLFFRILMAIFLNKGESVFLEALRDWFENKNFKEWIKKHILTFDEEKIDAIYELQNEWSKKNDSFTPQIFINEYFFPKTYDRESLPFFIKELIDDEFFNT